MAAYYNEFDPQTAAWLRELIKAGAIAPGDVDERSIEDVQPDDLKGYIQCHFFAGVGIWSYALRAAGWGDDTPVWTGSCPCQPFSAAGKAGGFTDERHLWPAWFHLIAQREPGVVFGEQVASKDGLTWLDLVQTDLEAAEYAFGAIDLCAAGVGSPNIRQRDWFVAERLGDPLGAGLQGHPGHGDGGSQPGRQQADAERPTAPAGGVGRVADAHGGGCDGRPKAPGRDDGNRQNAGRTESDGSSSRRSGSSGLADTAIGPQRTLNGQPGEGTEPQIETGGRDLSDGQPPAGPTNGLWRDADWLFCRDGKWRPVRPGSSPLANGAPARVGRLRGYGNAINAEAARIFIEAYKESQA